MTRLGERMRRWRREARNAATATAKNFHHKTIFDLFLQKACEVEGCSRSVGPSAYIHPFNHTTTLPCWSCLCVPYVGDRRSLCMDGWC